MSINDNSIEYHSKQAPYYGYRTPYLPQFFNKISAHLGLDGKSVLLDACCGCGEIAIGLSQRAAKIYAVDGSAEMLAHAKHAENISYQQCDLVEGNYVAPAPVDHILIGRAIHWLTPESLHRLIDNNMSAGGKILVCSTQWEAVGAWESHYRRMVAKYRKRVPSQHDFSGKSVLGPLGYIADKPILSAGEVGFDIEYLVRHTLATLYDEDLDAITADLHNFRAEMNDKLLPFAIRGRLKMQIGCWALPYGALSQVRQA